MMSKDSVKVAVRVRPFTTREQKLDAQCIVFMYGKKTTVYNPKTSEQFHSPRDNCKEFTYDFSYNSFDPDGREFHPQSVLFDDLGKGVVENACAGYNACVLAYGQTGSGKTYTMMGPVDDSGLIPRVCNRLLDSLDRSGAVNYSIQVAYVEIYNEQARDLLCERQVPLRVREHPTSGPYVEGLTQHTVTTSAEILELLKCGNTRRSTASTAMNDASSRSHAIFTIFFSQACIVDDLPSEKSSKVHLVDLAGSECCKLTGATGSRLREGGHINKSLATLGSVISALANCDSNKRSAFVPYRNSVLTWLLRDSLGGNTRTVMIATISPADVCHAETLSTLRYAQRAKFIVNRATVNENANARLICVLRREIGRLRALVAASDAPPAVEDGASDALQLLLEQKEARAEQMTSKWMLRWRLSQRILQERRSLALRLSSGGAGVVLESQRPHLIGVDGHITGTGVTLYQLQSNCTSLGCGPLNDVLLQPVCGVLEHHCRVLLNGRLAWLQPLEGAVCTIDGVPVIGGEQRLMHGCVLTLGDSLVFRFNHPSEADHLKRLGVRSTRSRLSLLARSTTGLTTASSLDNMMPTVSLDAELNTSSSFLRPSSVDRLHKRYHTLSKPVICQPQHSSPTYVTASTKTSSLRHLPTELDLLIDQPSASNCFSGDDELQDSLTQTCNRCTSSACPSPCTACRRRSQELDAYIEQEVRRRVSDRLASHQQTDRQLAQLDSSIQQELQQLNVSLACIAGDGDATVATGSCYSADDPDYDATSSLPAETSAADALITVAGFLLRGSGWDVHVVFQVRVRAADGSCSLFRRFSQFRQLRDDAVRRYGVYAQLPTARPFRRRTCLLLAAERLPLLQLFLRQLVGSCAAVPGCPLYATPVTRGTLTRLSTFFQRSVCEHSPAKTG